MGVEWMLSGCCGGEILMVRLISFTGALLLHLSLIDCFGVFAEVLLSVAAVVIVGCAHFLALSVVFHG